jgi:hypothetical protein
MRGLDFEESGRRVDEADGAGRRARETHSLGENDLEGFPQLECGMDAAGDRPQGVEPLHPGAQLQKFVHAVRA